MNVRAAVFLLALAAVGADKPPLPPGEREPILHLEAGGPTAVVTALAFDPDGTTLHAGGYDKVVRTWKLNRKTGQFIPQPDQTYRIPLGPGRAGVINTLAVSPDGKWLAVAGSGLSRGWTGARQPGVILPRSGWVDDAMRRDQGMIYLFERDKPESVRLLRGHAGVVFSLAFTPRQKGTAMVLASAAREWDGKKYLGRVRLWDLDRGQERPGGMLDPLPDPVDRAPGLAVWHVGEQLRVAATCQDGQFRLGDVGGSKKWRSKEDGFLNGTLAVLPDSADSNQVRVFSGSTRRRAEQPKVFAGFLRAWRLPSGRTPEYDPDRKVELAVRDSVPTSLGLASGRLGRPGRGSDLAAVILRYPDKDPHAEKFELHLVGLGAAGEKFGRRRGRADLWTGRPPRQPILATAPGGRFVAVAGHPLHHILVFAIADLLAGKTAPSQQPLRSEGIPGRYIAFVKKGEQVGLALNGSPIPPPSPGAELRGPRDGDRVFDFNSNRLGDAAGWRLAAPSARGWQIKQSRSATDKVAATFQVSGSGLPEREVTLKPNQHVTQYALLPPGGRLDIPLLAVAYQELGETTLVLLDARTGQSLRQLMGHVNPIRALAFSADGRLLASAADDQTVSVWSLTDIDPPPGTQGQLRGLVVTGNPDRAATVASLEPDLRPDNRRALKDAGVQPGDVVEALLVGEKPQTIASAAAFYRAIWLLSPEKPVKLRIRGRPDVQLLVDRAIDERKPLFSLFVTRQGRWVGWSPLGPYDSSAGATEAGIGWHTNTGDAAAPVKYEKAVDHKEYFKPKILGRLVTRGNPSAALQDGIRNPGTPALTAWVEAGGKPPPQDDRGRSLVRRPPLTLAATVNDVDADKISWVRWQFEDGDWQEFTSDLGRMRKADLSRLPWKRGERKVQVALRTYEVNARQAQKLLRVLYLPPPPQVTFDEKWLTLAESGKSVRRQNLTFRARVRPGSPGERVRVVLRHKGKTLRDELVGPGCGCADLDLREELTLEENLNEVVFEARNVGPLLKGYEGYEEVRRSFPIRYSRVPLPEIVLESITPAPGGGRPKEGQVVVVAEKKVRLRGTITAEEDLTVATLGGKDLLGGKPFVSRRDLPFKIDLEYPLKVGRQTLEIVARAKGSKPRTFAFVIDCRPPLPGFTRTAPRDSDWLASDQRTIRLAGNLDPFGDEDYEIRVLHKGGVVAHTLDTKKKTLEVPRLALDPGNNEVAVVVGLGGRSRTTPLRFYVRRPPAVVKLDHPRAATTAVVSLEARVETPEDLPLVGARLTGDHMSEGLLDPHKDMKVVGGAGAMRIWRVTLTDIPLTENKANTIRLWVGNADGESEHRFTIAGPRPVVQKPAIRLIDPDRDVTVVAPTYPLRFTVRSSKPLRRVAILRMGQEVHAFPAGGLTLDQRVNLELKPGVNVFTVVAVNEGGEESRAVTIGRIQETVYVHFEGLQAEMPAEVVRPKPRLREVVFDRVRTGELLLSGSVEWPAGREDLDRPVAIRVWVNGLEQFSGALDRRQAGRRRTFRVPVRLNRDRDNEVALDFSGLKPDPSTPPRFRVALCDSPAREQRLHLLVVGVSVENPETLVERVLQTFQVSAGERRRLRALGLKPARRGPPRPFAARAFKEARLYGPLPPDATREDVYEALVGINATLRGEQSPYHEIVVVYFQGEAAVENKQHYLLTQESKLLKNYPATALTLGGLRERLADAPGAQLLLLDLEQTGRSEPAAVNFSAFGRVGVFHYAWLRTDRGTAPPRLVEALEQPLARSASLREVKDALDRAAGAVKDKVVFAAHLSPELAALVLGTPARE